MKRTNIILVGDFNFNILPSALETNPSNNNYNFSFFVNVGKSLSNSTQENSSIPSSQPTSNKKEISTLTLCNIAFNNDFLKYAFKCMKNGKSSDPGSISRNELRLTGDTLLDYFMPLGQRSI